MSSVCELPLAPWSAIDTYLGMPKRKSQAVQDEEPKLKAIYIYKLEEA
jgi:hypothetical protein